MAIDVKEWAKTLKPGDKVKTTYLTNLESAARLKGLAAFDEYPKTATVEYVLLNASCQSGILIKLKEYQSPLDLFWVIPM